MKIGIFGGSFDPCHIEHQKLAKAFILEKNLSKLFVMPLCVAPHKNTVSKAKHRFNMAKIAYENMQNVEVSDYELKQKTTSYSYITLEHFAEKYPNDELYFFVGEDSINDFFTWKNPQIISKLATIVVARRENALNFEASLQRFEEKFSKKVEVLDYVGKDISSTEIRILLEFGLPCEEYLDERVLKYIKKHKLFCEHKKMISKIKKYLPLKRYTHTAYVVLESQKLARMLKIDMEKAFVSASLHDVCKKMTVEQLEKIGFVNKDNLPNSVVHAFAGVYAAKKLFNIKDEEILNAIKFHTTGRPNMSTLEKLIYVADAIEKTRKFEGVQEIRQAVYTDFEKGFFMCLESTLNKLHSRADGSDISEITQSAYEFYKKEKLNES